MSINKFNAEGYYDPTAYEALTAVEKEERAAKTQLPLVYIASPFAGDIERNTERARGYCRFAVSQKVIPLAPHLLYPQFMDEEDKQQREQSIRFALILLDKCDELWVFGNTISEGMSREIAKAKKKGKPIRYFSSACKEVSE